jgi:hypothetical protein
MMVAAVPLRAVMMPQEIYMVLGIVSRIIFSIPTHKKVGFFSDLPHQASHNPTKKKTL